MKRQVKWLTGIIGVALIAILIILCLPSPALAQEGESFAIFPAEITVDGILPGQSSGEFLLGIDNHMDRTVSFTTSVYQPPAYQPGETDCRREGNDALPDINWISFDKEEIEIPANSTEWVKATLTIPREEQWQNKNYECWLQVTSEKIGIVQYKLNSRLYIITGSGLAPLSTSPYYQLCAYRWHHRRGSSCGHHCLDTEKKD